MEQTRVQDLGAPMQPEKFQCLPEVRANMSTELMACCETLVERQRVPPFLLGHLEKLKA